MAAADAYANFPCANRSSITGAKDRKAPTLHVIANGRLFNTASSYFARPMTQLIQPAAVAVRAVQRFGGECLHRNALATSFGSSGIAGTNDSELWQIVRR